MCGGARIALDLKLLPENFIRDYIPKDEFLVADKFDDLLRNYIRFYEKDIAKRCGLYTDYILYEKIPDVITDRNSIIYRGWTWHHIFIGLGVLKMIFN